MYWKVIYTMWYSVNEEKVIYIEADTKEEALRKADSKFGYEQIDIKAVIETNPENILKEVIFK